jgi:hypothetical protein
LLAACSTDRRLAVTARTAIRLALDHTADDETSDGILRLIINPSLDRIRQAFEAKAYELLKQHELGHPITYNHYLTDNIQKARQDHSKKMLAAKIENYWGVNPLGDNHILYVSKGSSQINTRSLLQTLTTSTEADMENFACSEALDCMEAYYKVRVFLVLLFRTPRAPDITICGSSMR